MKYLVTKLNFVARLEGDYLEQEGPGLPAFFGDSLSDINALEFCSWGSAKS